MHSEMDKLEQLLHMTEHPEEYTDEQLESMLADEEMRAYYELTAMARNGFEARKARTAAATTDRAPLRATAHSQEQQASDSQHKQRAQTRPLWQRAAAAVAVALVVSGIALAAIFMNRQQPTATPTIASRPAATNQQPPTISPQAPRTEQQLVMFEDAELQTILQQVGDYYQKNVVFSNDSTRHIRLYIKWNKAESANEMIERLNNFEKVNIKMDGNDIVSE